MRYEKFITRQMLRDNPRTLFVFGDNLERRGLGGQAKEMRGEPNAVGVPTKKRPSMADDAFLEDSDFDRYYEDFVKPFIRLTCHIFSGQGDVVWPKDGIGTGLAQLPSKAPKIWAYLEDNRKLLERIRKGRVLHE